MKKFKLTFLLTVLMSMVGTKAFAHDIEVENADGVTIYYKFINDKTELEVTYEGGNYLLSSGYIDNVVIPESVIYNDNAYPVTAIGDYAFHFCSKLTAVTIPNGITSIGYRAFRGCSRLTAVTIPNSIVFIGEESFANCSGLTSVIIPNSVARMGANPFSGCSGLKEIVVESGNPNYDSRENCNAIINTNSNELISGCKVTQIPNSVTSIGKGAFAGCGYLFELIIPNSVTSIGDRVFVECVNLGKITIPNSVTTIGSKVFDYCTGLQIVILGNSVTSIGEGAFNNCRLDLIYSLNTTPPSISNTTDYPAFTDIQYESDCWVCVPEEALAAYQNADVWKDFKHLEVISDDDDIDAIMQVGTTPVLIQSASGQITVTGLDDGTMVAIYGISGQQVGTAVSTNGQTVINTNLAPGSIAIVKIGDRSIKITVK